MRGGNQCFICCYEFALCKACKEGTRKTFRKPGWMENRTGFFAFALKREKIHFFIVIDVFASLRRRLET